MEVVNKLNFTPETPFGIPLYPIFEKAFEATVGFPASEFQYQQAVTPLSTINEGKVKTYCGGSIISANGML